MAERWKYLIKSINNNQSLPFCSQNRRSHSLLKQNIFIISLRETTQKVSFKDLKEHDINGTSGCYILEVLNQVHLKPS